MLGEEMGPRGKGVAICAALACALTATSSASAAYAPIDRPGPTLTVSKADKEASLKCTANVRNAKREPVLLLPATGVNSQQNFSWNYERAFKAEGIPYCTSDAPRELNTNMGDIQSRAEYVVFGIRKMYKMAGRRIATLGHSQGGMVMRWPLRFWPDTRPMVKDVIGMAGSNHGTLTADPTCIPDCAPAIWQQRATSKFTEALNSRQETFSALGGYTEIYTHTDVIVTPNLDSTGSSSVHGPGKITNVATQDVCATNLFDHLLIGTVDPVAWALVKDALERDGPANPTKLPANTCSQLVMPGINVLTLPTDLAASGAALGTNIATYPHVPAEPPLRCYVTASC